jgi:hypothetical protein
MAAVRLLFHAFVIDQEGIGTDDEGDYLDGEVQFDAVSDGTADRGLVARVKQAAGSSFSDPLEVQWPGHGNVRLPYLGFRDCVEWYVRRQVAAQADARPRAERPGAVRIRGRRLSAEATCQVAGAAL